MTKTIRVGTIDRTGWPPGPWDDEPDELEWPIDRLDGYIGLILRNDYGNLCGYVALPPGHALHGRVERGCEFLAVHGGITFAAPWTHEGAVMWLVGFDCLHFNDDAPGMRVAIARLGPEYVRNHPFGSYRNIDYVRAQVERLASQLAAVDIQTLITVNAEPKEGSS